MRKSRIIALACLGSALLFGAAFAGAPSEEPPPRAEEAASVETDARHDPAPADREERHGSARTEDESPRDQAPAETEAPRAPAPPAPLNTREAVAKVVAEAAPERAGARAASAPSLGGGGSAVLTVGEMLLKLALVLAAAYGVSLLLRRLNLTRVGAPRGQSLQVEETLPLGQHRALYIVRVGSRRLLLGASGAQISLLTELGEETPEHPFASHLGQAAARVDAEAPKEGEQ